MHPITQLGFNRSQPRDHPLLGRFAPDDEGSTVARRPAIMGETQEREGVRFPFATSFSVLSGEPPKLDQPCLFRVSFQTELSQQLSIFFQATIGYCPLLNTNNQ